VRWTLVAHGDRRKRRHGRSPPDSVAAEVVAVRRAPAARQAPAAPRALAGRLVAAAVGASKRSSPCRRTQRQAGHTTSTSTRGKRRGRCPRGGPWCSQPPTPLQAQRGGMSMLCEVVRLARRVSQGKDALLTRERLHLLIQYYLNVSHDEHGDRIYRKSCQAYADDMGQYSYLYVATLSTAYRSHPTCILGANHPSICNVGRAERTVISAKTSPCPVGPNHPRRRRRHRCRRRYPRRGRRRLVLLLALPLRRDAAPLASRPSSTTPGRNFHQPASRL
jgi:hypothetical protein